MGAMKVIILGSGSSVGVPSIGCRCEVCNSTNPKNKRTRASIYIETETTSLIVDTGPDLRVQALQNNITKVDGVFYTHSHADHINGIDDMKSFNFLAQKPLPAFGDKFTMDYIRKAFPYVFTENAQGNWYKPCLVAKANFLMMFLGLFNSKTLGLCFSEFDYFFTIRYRNIVTVAYFSKISIVKCLCKNCI